MKRLISIICVLLMLSLVAGCAPDNIKTPIPSDKPSPEQNDPTQKPDENDGSSEQTPEKQPETVHVPFVNIVPEKESNTDVMPQASVDGIEFCDTASLKDKTLKMFVREGGAFYAGKLSEEKWLDALKDELGLTVEKTVTSNSTLYSKQLIASKTGKGADLVTVDMNNVFASLNLMKTPLESFDAEETDIPFSLAAFNITGGKVFTGIGNARVLWYNKNIIKDDSPFKLYKDGGWTFDVFASHLVSTQSNKQALFDTYSNLIPFNSAAGKQTTGIVNGEYVIDLESDEAKKAAQEYDTLFAKDGAKCDKSHSFVRGNTAFLFAATPNVNGFDVGFAPVPACAEGASGVSELCGTGLGISKNIYEEKEQAALTLAMLWCARYTESRLDTLLFDLKLDKPTAESYINLCENESAIFTADSEITSVLGEDKVLFDSDSIKKVSLLADILNKRS